MSMTSTSFTIGLQGDGSRNSSRVLRPPGGGHTDIFGGPGEAEPTKGRRQGYAQPPSSIGQGDEPKPKPNGIEPAQNGAVTPEAPAPQQASPAQPEPKVVQIESPVEAAPAPKAAPAPLAAGPQGPAEPPKRVRVPPGGFSSGLW